MVLKKSINWPAILFFVYLIGIPFSYIYIRSVARPNIETYREWKVRDRLICVGRSVVWPVIVPTFVYKEIEEKYSNILEWKADW